jgi:hypothetical protein
MITPSYGITSTERVLPRLALDFTTAVLDPRVTVTRALNTATRVNSSGYIEGVNADLPRFDYSPASVGTSRGLLIEESRINALPRSQEFENNTAWEKSGTAAITADQIAAPDNTQTADLFRCGSTAASEVRRVGQTIAAGSHTLSIFARKEVSSYVVVQVQDITTSSFQRVWFNIELGTVGSSTSAGTNITLLSTKIDPYANGFYRCSISVSLTAGTTTGRTTFFLSEGNGVFTGTALSGIYIWGAQLEAGAFATSYIPTTSTSLTRNADVVSMTGTNFSDWFNASEGTFSIDCIINTKSSAQIVMEMSDGTTSNRLQFQRDAGSAVLSYVAINSGSITVNLQKASAFVNDVASITAAYKLNNYGVAVNGGATTTDTSSAVPAVDRMRIGATVAGTALSNGWYQKILFYPQRLTDAEIQAFSK